MPATKLTFAGVALTVTAVGAGVVLDLTGNLGFFWGVVLVLLAIGGLELIGK